MTKIRVVWNNGTEQIFNGIFMDVGTEVMYLVSSDNRKFYLSMYQMRYIEIIEA